MLAQARLLALAALAAWALWGMGAEAGRTLAVGLTGGERAPVVVWRLGSEPAARLAAFLEPVDALLPPGSVVVFATGDGDGDPEYFQSLWAAYLLPRHRVVRLAHPRARLAGEYLAAYRTTVDHPRAGSPRPLPGGVLYRVRPPP